MDRAPHAGETRPGLDGWRAAVERAARTTTIDESQRSTARPSGIATWGRRLSHVLTVTITVDMYGHMAPTVVASGMLRGLDGYGISI